LYVIQTSVTIFWVEVSLSLLVALGGLVGIIGSCFASRRFVRAFSIITWINCVISIIQHISSLIIVGLNRQSLINECIVTGKLDISPAEVNSFYTPINRNAPSNNTTAVSPNDNVNYDNCWKEVEVFFVVAAVAVLFVLFLQFYFATVVASYSAKLTFHPKHTKLMNQQDWDEQHMPMRESVY